MGELFTPLKIHEFKVSWSPLTICIEGDEALDSNYIRVQTIQGHESISQAFQLTAELRADDRFTRIPHTRMLDSSCIGCWARLGVAISESKFRYFRGIITELALAAPGVYTITLQPPLQLLSLRNRYKIYQNCDIQELLRELFATELLNPGFVLRFDFDDSLSLTRIQDWMQAGETDLEFMQRIIGKASIYYYFIHEEHLLTLVFSNSPTQSDSVSIPASDHGSRPIPLRYTYTSIAKLGLQQGDLFTDMRYSIKLMPGYVRSLLTRQAAEWESDIVASYTSHEKSRGEMGATGYQHYRCYDYGASEEEAEGKLTKICQQIATESETLSGTVTTPLLSPGYTFELTDPILQQQMSEEDTPIKSSSRPEFDGKVFVVTRIDHKISTTEPYSATVEATSVNSQSDQYEQTLLTPFSIANTHQGNVLAKVLDHEVPKGWRYRSKDNFQPESGQASFEGQAYPERGCLVRLVTGQEYWVALSRSSQTVPEVGAMVMIGRGSNESEQPELQQVVASHGSKVIQPAGRRSASWTANTNWGSSYSTSYGDSISIRYGHNSATDLNQAIRLVESAYDGAGMADTKYGNTSYSKGSSWNVSLSDNADKGASSASISQGSSFNESHSKHNYGYSSVDFSENYSEVGKSASVSTVGKYTADVDLQSPSFIDGRLPMDISEYSAHLGTGDTFNRSTVWGKSINSNGIGIPAPGVLISSVLPGGSYGASAILGISESESTTIGATFNSAMMVGLSFSSNVNLANQYSHAFTLGDTSSLETRIGNVSSLSTTIGTHSSISTNISATDTLATNVGANVNTQLNVSDNINTSLTLGTSTDLTSYIGARNSLNTFIGATIDTSLSVAAKQSSSVVVGASDDTSVFIGARNSTNVMLGLSNETVVNVSDRSSTQVTLGPLVQTSVNIGSRATTSIDLTAAVDTSIKLGAAATFGINISDSVDIQNNVSTSLSLKNNLSASMELVNSASVSAKITNTGGFGLEVEIGPGVAGLDERQQARIRATILEIINGIDAKF